LLTFFSTQHQHVCIPVMEWLLLTDWQVQIMCQYGPFEGGKHCYFYRLESKAEKRCIYANSLLAKNERSLFSQPHRSCSLQSRSLKTRGMSHCEINPSSLDYHHYRHGK
jgi:hypothetical protein